MPRSNRIDIPNGLHHVTRSGLERRDIVRDDDNRSHGRRLFKRVARRCRWRVFAVAADEARVGKDLRRCPSLVGYDLCRNPLLLASFEREPEMAIPHAFTVIYEPAEEGGFYAHVPALDVTTEGETLEEAKLMARDAIENVLACRRQLNLPIPTEAGCETIEVGA